MNYEWSSETVRILSLCMGVVPVGARLVGSEVVGEAGSRGYWTLRDHGRAVHVS